MISLGPAQVLESLRTVMTTSRIRNRTRHMAKRHGCTIRPAAAACGHRGEAPESITMEASKSGRFKVLEFSLLQRNYGTVYHRSRLCPCFFSVAIHLSSPSIAPCHRYTFTPSPLSHNFHHGSRNEGSPFLTLAPRVRRIHSKQYSLVHPTR
jgi:hypothetical protein